VAEIEKILTLECNLRSLAIFWEWSRALKRAGTPQRNGYLWDGLFNPTVYIYQLPTRNWLSLAVVFEEALLGG